jgi:hypothetical protein
MGWHANALTPAWLSRERPDLFDAAGGWPADPIEQVALEIGMLVCLMEEAAARHPDWSVVDHEDLCAAPTAGYATLFDRVGLGFNDEVRSFVESTNRDGRGHDITRVAAQAPLRWQRLSPEDRDRALTMLRRLPIRVAPLPA